MRILFTCGREPEYTRNDVLLRALRPHHDLISVTDSRPGSLTARTLRLLPRLLQALRREHYDLIIVGFYGYGLVPLVRRFTLRPILFDAFVSNYDTLCFDRRRFAPHSLPGRLAFALDRLGCASADRVLLDTAAHRDFFVETFHLSPEKLRHLYVGCNEDLFYPQERKRDETFDVLHYSSFLPLHGVEHILAAAAELHHEPNIRFRFIGAGMRHDPARRLAQSLKLTNVEFVPPAPYTQLPGEIAAADLCLGGPFGDTPKARRIIPGKIFQFLSMARPVVAGDTPGNRELLRDEQDALLVPLADPQALAAAILRVQRERELATALAAHGHATYRQRASEAVIGHELERLVGEML
jgi:glycosyltransferase involved in cell wall biosynthesis